MTRIAAVSRLESVGYPSDLAAEAARVALRSALESPLAIDYLLLVTTTPDFPLPTTACLVQANLDLPQDIGALDIALGPTGYVHALLLAQSLIADGQANAVLVLTADDMGNSVHATASIVERSPEDRFLTDVSFGEHSSDQSSTRVSLPAGGTLDLAQIGGSSIPAALAAGLEASLISPGDRLLITASDADGAVAEGVLTW